MNYLTLSIESNRLLLVPVSTQHANEIFFNFDPNVTKYMYPSSAKDISETIAFINSSRKKMEEGIEFVYAILLKPNFDFIGCGGVHHFDQLIPEFGIWTKSSSHGNHFGREAVLLTYEHFKSKYKAFKYPVDKDNIPSKKIALSLGGIISKTYVEESMSHRILHIEEYVIYSKNE
ncbi:MAG: GNAT family N-acetyltransferase [Candidatus Izemoplasmatales bacterium]|nr:GNAT family N-acetyltransferase [Candidatus Izemoplasmatales bacterium]